jgi:hypothetical protein
MWYYDDQGDKRYRTDDSKIIERGLSNILKLQTDQKSKELSYKIILMKVTSMRELKQIKQESVVNCDNCIICGQDKNFDHVMHYFYDCEVAKVIMLAMTRQVEKNVQLQQDNQRNLG